MAKSSTVLLGKDGRGQIYNLLQVIGGKLVSDIIHIFFDSV